MPFAFGRRSAEELDTSCSEESTDADVSPPLAKEAPNLRPVGATAFDEAVVTPQPSPSLPDYMVETYSWAYLNRFARAIFDRSIVVSAILWGNAKRLADRALAEVEPGSRVLQAACVYGNFSKRLADRLGRDGHLDVIDIAPIQVRFTRLKLAERPQAEVRLADAANPGEGVYDAICCFFLLHEVPEDYKSRIVDALLDRIEPDGKVIFVDYHRPWLLHPLRPITSLVFTLLEPFARALWRHEIRDYASRADEFTWRKETLFGHLYQVVVAEPKTPAR